jgi:hypothetical protein
MIETNITSTTVIVYNRIPKCGSMLMNTLLRRLSKTQGEYIFIESKNYTQYRLSLNEQHKLNTMLITLTHNSSSKPIVYDQHFHFFQLTSKLDITFYYINQIRDPLALALSQFDYERYLCAELHIEQACSMLHPSYRNITMDECISNGADPALCLTRQYGARSMIAFFCGQSPICDDTITRPTSDAALALAKSNIEQYYIHINLVEYIESSLELLEYIQPSIFTGIRDIYKKTVKLNRVNETPKDHRHPISNKTQSILRQLLTHEYELYEFVRIRFINHYTRVFHRAPVYHGI